MKIVTFGEIMLRLRPEGFLRFAQADKFEATFGGAEANVAVNLAQLGCETAFVSKLPAHAIGEMAVASLRKYGVDVTEILRGGDRVGIYFIEKGMDARASVCVYDRARSAIATAEPGEFDWDAILDGADAFFFTGITPALGKNMVEACKNACESAKKRGILVCCDTNFRAALWSLSDASKTMSELLPLCDLIISNAGLANDMFTLGVPSNGELLGQNGLRAVGEKLRERFGCKAVALTQRETISSNHHRFSGAMLVGDNFACSRVHDIDIVDRVGSGDAFAAGTILAVLEGMSAAEGAEFAVAASVLKHSIEGDVNLSSRAEIEKLARGGGSRIVR